MPCVQNINLVPVPGIDLLSEKEHPGSFGRHYLLHTTTNLYYLVYLMRRRKHDLVDDDDGDGRKIKTMYAAFVPRSYGCSSFSLTQIISIRRFSTTVLCTTPTLTVLVPIIYIRVSFSCRTKKTRTPSFEFPSNVQMPDERALRTKRFEIDTLMKQQNYDYEDDTALNQ